MVWSHRRRGRAFLTKWISGRIFVGVLVGIHNVPHTTTIRRAVIMGSSSAGMGLFWLRGWHVPFVLFLAFLVPVTPLLAAVQDDVV